MRFNLICNLWKSICQNKREKNQNIQEINLLWKGVLWRLRQRKKKKMETSRTPKENLKKYWNFQLQHLSFKLKNKSFLSISATIYAKDDQFVLIFNIFHHLSVEMFILFWIIIIKNRYSRHILFNKFLVSIQFTLSAILRRNRFIFRFYVNIVHLRSLYRKIQLDMQQMHR